MTRDDFLCVACGHAEHADIVGAKEILRRGLKPLGNDGALPDGGLSLAACGELGAARTANGI